MLRTILCVAVALFVCGDLAMAKGQKGGPKPVNGTIKAVDATAGTLTVTVKQKDKSTEDRDFKVTDSTKVTVPQADGTTKDLTGKDGLKDPVVNVGAKVKVTAAADGTVSEVVVGLKKGGHKKKNQ